MCVCLSTSKAHFQDPPSRSSSASVMTKGGVLWMGMGGKSPMAGLPSCRWRAQASVSSRNSAGSGDGRWTRLGGGQAAKMTEVRGEGPVRDGGRGRRAAPRRRRGEPDGVRGLCDGLDAGRWRAQPGLAPSGSSSLRSWSRAGGTSGRPGQILGCGGGSPTVEGDEESGVVRGAPQNAFACPASQSEPASGRPLRRRRR